jgi:hypothetical protein
LSFLLLQAMTIYSSLANRNARTIPVEESENAEGTYTPELTEEALNELEKLGGADSYGPPTPPASPTGGAGTPVGKKK